MDEQVVDWLMEGDPAIRWQTQRDLLDAPEAVWDAERQNTLTTGWGAAFLAALGPDGEWPKGRWTGTVWTLLQLIECGLPAQHPPLQAAAARFIDENLTAERARDPKWLLGRVDLCHLGFWLRIGSYYLGPDPRLASLGQTLLTAGLPDGGFNCRIRNYPDTHHSSFHTTFNVLEGLREAAMAGVIGREECRSAEARALEFMLAHRMYRSDHTGAIIDQRFKHLSYPSHWHYTVLRGLDYMRRTPEIADPRLQDPCALLEGRRKPSGRWPVEKRIPGVEHFDMERQGGDSRWNTLRALRALKSRQSAGPKA